MRIEKICDPCTQRITGEPAGGKPIANVEDNDRLPQKVKCDCCHKTTIKSPAGLVPRTLYAAIHCFPKPNRSKPSFLERIEAYLYRFAPCERLLIHQKDIKHLWQIQQEITVVHGSESYQVAKVIDLPVAVMGEKKPLPYKKAV